MGLDERGGEDGEAAAFVGVACAAEEFFRLDECLRVHAAGHGASAARLCVVISAREARDGVEEDEDVLAEFDEAARAVGDDLGDLDVARAGLVEGGGIDLRALHAADEVGDFLGAFVHEEEDDVQAGIAADCRLREFRHEDRFSRARRGDEEAALAAADGGDEVHGARGERTAGAVVERDACVGEACGECVEILRLLPFRDGRALDGEDFVGRHVLLAMVRWAEAYGDEVAALELEPLRELEADERILRAGAEAVTRESHEAAAVAGDEFRDAFREEREAERMVGAQQIEHEVVAVFFRIHAEAEKVGALEELTVRERVEFVHPQIARAQFRRSFVLHGRRRLGCGSRGFTLRRRAPVGGRCGCGCGFCGRGLRGRGQRLRRNVAGGWLRGFGIVRRGFGQCCHSKLRNLLSVSSHLSRVGLPLSPSRSRVQARAHG